MLKPERRALHDLVDRIEAATAPLMQLLASEETDLKTVVATHIACCEALAASDEESVTSS